MDHSRIAVASDHSGYKLKEILKRDLEVNGYVITDFGAYDLQAADYPDFGFAVAKALSAKDVDRGVLVCGSGIGISIAANRFPDVRAALIHTELEACLARQHNDANIICFGARLIDEEIALKCLHVFLETPFEGGRHISRINKLSNPR